MSDSRPPIFDDGGGLPDVDRSRRRADSGRARRRRTDGDVDDPAAPSRPARERDVWDDAGDEQWRSPNYLFRRAIVVGIVVLAVAGIAILVGRLLGGDGDGSGSAFGSADWNHVVTIDDAVGTVVITDTDGEETNRFRLGLRPLTDTALIDRTLVAVDADTLGFVRLDAGDEITTTDITTLSIGSTGELLRPAGTTRTVLATDASSERFAMVHGPTAETLDTADADTVPGARYDLGLAVADPAGRHVLVTDSGNFQSVLFSFDRDEPSFFSGLALAVDDEIVVTAANVGTNANVAVFDHAGEPGVAAQTTSVRAAMIAGGDVILIGVDGEVLGLSSSSGEISELGDLTIGTVESGEVTVDGEHLVVTGADGTAVVDGTGTAIIELPDARPAASELDELAAQGASCLIVERSTDGEIAVVDLDTGAVMIEALATGDVIAPVDGCRPVVPTSSGYIALDAEGVTPVTLAGDVVAISPDGATLAVEQSSRVTLARRLTTESASDAAAADDDDDDEAPVDVGRSGRSLYFAEL